MYGIGFRSNVVLNNIRKHMLHVAQLSQALPPQCSQYILLVMDITSINPQYGS